MTERRSDAPRLEARGPSPVAANRGKARAGRAARSAVVAKCTRTQDYPTRSSSETMLKRLAQPEELAAKAQNMAPDLLSKMLSVQFLVSTRGTYSSPLSRGAEVICKPSQLPGIRSVFVCSEELLAGCARREDQSGGEAAGLTRKMSK